jgi:hypothetical protein
MRKQADIREEELMSPILRLMLTGVVALSVVAAVAPIPHAAAQGAYRRGPTQQAPETFSPEELVSSGHKFFGNVSRGLALTIQEAVRRWGQPNGYVLGQEASGAFFGGLRYGEGVLYTRNAGDRRVFWQGPSLGFDVGGEGARTMMLIYNLPSVGSLFQRFAGVDGSAYLVAGFGMTALTNNNIVVVPIRTGVGARLGVNLGYLKFTQSATWNPF